MTPVTGYSQLALYSRIGYVEYDRRLRGEASIVYLRKKLG